ncbi:MAG: PQQ-binding-like beta-propeller repeat protein, partial [Alteraurantiacibacter sp.]|nr:PQQ-binding-like beta-propeller repeat protein [Alteraurantiacibacter sp.]
MKGSCKAVLLAGLALSLAGCASVSMPPAASATAARADPLAHPAPGEWLSDGRDYTAQRFSPLTQITAANIGQLGLAWYADLETYRGVEATPLYADGVLYNTLAWNITTAYDARTGEVLWTYDPQVPREFGRLACCEPVSRGLALHGNKIIIATLDGRLIALDRATGRPIWTTRTFPLNSGYAYSITGAPRVFGDKVVVGQSGGDLGVRGFVSAYDVETGAEVWKFSLTPSPPDTPDGAASDPV